MEQVEPVLTLDQLLAVLGKQEGENAGYYTLLEWAARLNVSDNKMHKFLLEAKRRGLLQVTTLVRDSLDGIRRHVPGYKIAIKE